MLAPRFTRPLCGLALAAVLTLTACGGGPTGPTDGGGTENPTVPAPPPPPPPGTPPPPPSGG